MRGLGAVPRTQRPPKDTQELSKSRSFVPDVVPSSLRAVFLCFVSLAVPCTSSISMLFSASLWVAAEVSVWEDGDSPFLEAAVLKQDTRITERVSWARDRPDILLAAVEICL